MKILILLILLSINVMAQESKHIFKQDKDKIECLNSKQTMLQSMSSIDNTANWEDFTLIDSTHTYLLFYGNKIDIPNQRIFIAIPLRKVDKYYDLEYSIDCIAIICERQCCDQSCIQEINNKICNCNENNNPLANPCYNATGPKEFTMCFYNQLK